MVAHPASYIHCRAYAVNAKSGSEINGIHSSQDWLHKPCCAMAVMRALAFTAGVARFAGIAIAYSSSNPLRNAA